MQFKIDEKTRTISDDLFKIIEDANIGDYRTPQEWGVDGLTWEDKDWFHLTIFDNKIFIWRTIVDFDDPQNARQICEDVVEALKKRGIKAEIDELEAGHYTVDIWLKTNKKFEELSTEDIQKALEIFKIFRGIDEEIF